MSKSRATGLQPPADVVVRTSKEIREIISAKLRVKDIHVSDGSYGCYSRSELERFLASDNVDELKYKKDRFDCDNFALALAGREAEWFAGSDSAGANGSGKSDDVDAGVENGAGAFGSAFGIVHGDIRKAEADTTPRPHAINFQIDADGELWLIEPQTDAIFKPTANSTFWFTLC
jgi:hypothetical protein